MGKFSNWLETEKSPDYSFDRWLQSADNLKGQVDSMVGKAREKESELDHETEKKKKEIEDEDKDQDKENEKEFEFKDDNQKKLWNQLQKLAKELSGKESDDGKDSQGRAGHQKKNSSKS